MPTTAPRRRRAAAFALLAVSLLVGVVRAPAADAAVTGRAMWVWSTPEPAALVEFAGSHGVTEVYLAVPLDVTTSPQMPALRSVVTAAHAAGLRVQALGGDPGWVDAPAWALAHWVRPTQDTGLFDGLHLDVEPYGNPRWDSDQAGTVSRYLSLLDAVVQAAGARPVHADVPFWFPSVPTFRRRVMLDRAVLTRVTGVTVMAYRTAVTGPDSTTEIAAATLATGTDLGKPVRLGQETTFLGSDPAQVKQTFYGQPAGVLQAALEAIDAAQAGTPSYAGTSIQDDQGWAALLP